jgi:hypothetical protein
MKPTTLFWCAAAVAACASIPSPTPDQEARLAIGRSHLADDPLRALEVADELLAANPALRGARLLAAEGSLALARSGRGPAHLYLIDAAANFEKALAGVADVEAPAVLYLLAGCRHDLGEFEAGSQAASRAARAWLAIDEPGARRDAAEALMLAGRCDLQLFVAARQAERDAGKADARGRVPFGRDTLQLAQRAGGHFSAARRELPGPATLQLALLQQWLEQPSEVAREYERGLREAPDDTALHDAYIAWMRDAGQAEALPGAYARLVREQPSLPILRWHQARVAFFRADDLRRTGNFQGALAAYGKSEGLFAEYLAMVPAHADATNQWRALCHLSMARCAAESGDLTTAERHAMQAAATSPLATSYDDGQPQLVDSFGNHFLGALVAIHRALTEQADEPLARTLAFHERVLARYPDRWGFLYNNAALAARDLGVAMARDGDQRAAMELWERSYAHYQKAVELSPDDARIANDCGLVLIYHLHRDLDRARALCERAIALGTAQLAALPADASARDRENLEEAVGDAWQNLAVLARDHERRPFADYRRCCEEAVKYFPYQRREAARLLRSEGADDLPSTARADAAAGAATPQGSAAEALAKVAPAVKAKADAEDYDEALALLDGIARDCRDHAPYHVLRAELTTKLAAQARDAGRRGVDLFYRDAIAAWKRAVELDPEPVLPRQLLAQAQFDAGDASDAAQTLDRLLLHLQARGGGKPDELHALHLLRSRAAATAYTQKKQQGDDDKDLHASMRSSFRFLEERGLLDLPLLQQWSAAEQWAGAGAEAVNVYVRALLRQPDDARLFDPIIDTAANVDQLPLAVEALQARSDATGQWYLGKARYWLAHAQRLAGKPAEAQQTLDLARADFAASMQKNPAFRDSCEQWIAMCLGKKGTIALAEDDAGNAEAWLLESARLRPDRLVEDLGNGESTKRSLLLLVDKFLKRNDLAKVEAIARKAADAAPGDVDLQNNAGLFARDHGNALERAGRAREAQEMYEQSYKAYRRAHELDPANVRLRNDCALIAIWHLERDWEQSRQLLESAIADGERTLRDNPPDDRNEREQLDEAIGDCYENLALWHLKHSKDAAAAKAAAQKSQQFHPGQRRPNARRHLQAAERLLQGK